MGTGRRRIIIVLSQSVTQSFAVQCKLRQEGMDDGMHRSVVRYLVLAYLFFGSVLLHCYEFLAIDQPATSAVLCVHKCMVLYYFTYFSSEPSPTNSFFATLAEVNSTKIISHDKICALNLSNEEEHHADRVRYTEEEHLQFLQ